MSLWVFSVESRQGFTMQYASTQELTTLMELGSNQEPEECELEVGTPEDEWNYDYATDTGGTAICPVCKADDVAVWAEIGSPISLFTCLNCGETTDPQA